MQNSMPSLHFETPPSRPPTLEPGSSLLARGKINRDGWEDGKKKKGESNMPFLGKLGLGPPSCPLDILSECPSENHGSTHDTSGLPWTGTRLVKEGA
jgi:hypothetical protein